MPRKWAFRATKGKGVASSLASAPAPAKPTVPLASRGGSFSSEGRLHLCVFSPRIPPHLASCGSPSHSPSPAAAERAAHLLRDSWQHLLHHQDQLSGSGPTPTPPPPALPQTDVTSARGRPTKTALYTSQSEKLSSVPEGA